MFFKMQLPPSTKATSLLPLRWTWLASDMAMPPGAATSCNRAARLTPSPTRSATLYHHIAEIDPNSELYGRVEAVTSDDRSLNGYRRVGRIDDARELGQQAIPHQLEGPARCARSAGCTTSDHDACMAASVPISSACIRRL